MKNWPSKLWNWLGNQTTHNVLTVVLAAIAIYFGSQKINNIQITIDSIASDIQELYNRNVVEKFSFDDIEKFQFQKGEKTNSLKIVLRNKPIENSVMVWFGDQLTNPTNYNVKDSIVDLSLASYIDLELIKSLGDQDPNIIVISYTKAIPQSAQ